MYGLDINFLRDRTLVSTEGRPKAIQRARLSLREQTPIFLGVGLMLVLPAVAGGFWWFLGEQTAKTQEEIQAIEQKIQQLTAQNAKIGEIQKEIQLINDETQSLVSVFNQIKPWSAILEELRNQTPQGVQINNIQQGEVAGNPIPIIKLTINGYARNYDDVNNFLLALQNSKFFNAKTTKLQTTQLADLPYSIDSQLPITLPKGVQYTITTEINNIPASQLMQELERNGALGLVTRLKTLEKKGAIPK